jgi:hypothetical protein
MDNPIITYEEYHRMSMMAKDVDPGVHCLEYLANRFELNQSQRYWISFLYGTNYSATTTFLMYNEFPDFEGVDLARLTRWWEKWKSGLVFQSDRLRIKTSNQFIPSFISYREVTRGNSEAYFSSARSWQECYDKITAIRNFGRFSTFNYLDVLNRITDTKWSPTYLNMVEAESCRNGLCFAINKPDWVGKKLNRTMAQTLHNEFLRVLKENDGNIYQIETTLCAYKKYRWGKRWVGYYIERMRKEIEKMEAEFPDGIAWETLWQFRSETFPKKYLLEL